MASTTSSLQTWLRPNLLLSIKAGLGSPLIIDTTGLAPPTFVAVSTG